MKATDLIVVSRSEIEKRVNTLRIANKSALTNTIQSNIANELVALLQNSRPLSPILKKAFEAGGNAGVHLKRGQHDNFPRTQKYYDERKQEFLNSDI